jgi:chaperonin GroES
MYNTNDKDNDLYSDDDAYEAKLSLDELEASDNITELLDDDDLSCIGQEVVRGYDIDEESRTEWKDIVDHVMRMLNQKIEQKNTPWPGASNLKFPVIVKAVLNYVSRTIPEYIQGDKVVKCRTVGADPDGSKFARANNVSTYMSWQFLNDIEDWENGLDKLLHVVATRGIAFKKTYYNTLKEKVVSELCLPNKICVNHDTQSLHAARRVTHIIVMSQNDVLERQRVGLFCKDIDISSLRDFAATEEGGKVEAQNYEDEDYPIHLLEQHCFLDLDCDGYREPYIVTVHKESKQVLRIVNRFDKIKKNKAGQVINIKPVQYFTDYHFIPCADGGYYSHGLGTLMLPFNTAANTLWNQLVNAGTLSTTSTGFINNGFRIKNGEFKVKMGEYMPIGGSSTVDIDKAIYTIPFKEPSDVLFKLLDMLLKACDDLSGTTDASQGKEHAQNTASTTVSQLIEQSAKVYAAINKRMCRAQAQEYGKVYKLNYKHLTNKQYRDIIGDDKALVSNDFEIDTMVVIPIADPDTSSINQRVHKAIVIQSLKTVDPRAADQYLLDAMQVEKSSSDLLLPAPDPKAPPSLQDQLTQSTISLNQANAAKLSNDTQLDQQRLQLEALKAQDGAKATETMTQESAVRQWKMQKDASHNDIKTATTQAKMQSEQAIKIAHLKLAAQKNNDQNTVAQTQANTKAAQLTVDAHLDLAKMHLDNSQHIQGLNHDAAKTVLNAQQQKDAQNNSNGDI